MGCPLETKTNNSTGTISPVNSTDNPSNSNQTDNSLDSNNSNSSSNANCPAAGPKKVLAGYHYDQQQFRCKSAADLDAFENYLEGLIFQLPQGEYADALAACKINYMKNHPDCDDYDSLSVSAVLQPVNGHTILSCEGNTETCPYLHFLGYVSCSWTN